MTAYLCAIRGFFIPIFIPELKGLSLPYPYIKTSVKNTMGVQDLEAITTCFETLLRKFQTLKPLTSFVSDVAVIQHMSFMRSAKIFDVTVISY